jgi:predicted ribosome quality control (RQC) complex YloA/Tae2 family protein
VLGLRELERVASAVSARFGGARLERVVQREGFELELGFAGAGRAALLLSCRPRTARASLRQAPAAAPPAPPPFAQYLRAHLPGARLAAARVRDGDRILSLAFEAAGGRFELLLQLLGPRSNVYLLDGRSRLLLALRPLDETRRDLAGGEPWRPPASAPPPPGEDRFEDVPEAELLAAVEARYAALEAGAESEDLRRRLERGIERQRRALDKKERLLAADLKEGERAAEYGRLGELLKGVLSEVPARASAVEARDFATGQPVRIALDPTLSPAANLEALFRRQKKAERQALRARQEQGVLAARRGELAALEAGLAAAAGGEELAAFAARPEVQRLLARHAPVARPAPRPAAERPRRGEVPARLRPRRYRGRDGLEIWVGRSDEGNDYLTTRLARGRDLFFHLDGAPGSHVVLRTEGREDPPPEALLEAAELAVHFSGQKQATRADVHVAAIRDVSKPKGAKPGLVHVHRGRTLHLRRDPQRLERILASRLEE